MKINPVGTEFHVGRRTDRHDEAFGNFVNAPTMKSASLVTKQKYKTVCIITYHQLLDATVAPETMKHTALYIMYSNTFC